MARIIISLKQAETPKPSSTIGTFLSGFFGGMIYGALFIGIAFATVYLVTGQLP
jgi:hypothetical protein